MRRSSARILLACSVFALGNAACKSSDDTTTLPDADVPSIDASIDVHPGGDAAVDVAASDADAAAPDADAGGDASAEADGASDTDAADAGVVDAAPDGTISIDAASLGDGGGLFAAIPVPGEPVALALDVTHGRLYAALADTLSNSNLGIAVIDTASDQYLTTMTLPPSAGAYPFSGPNGVSGAMVVDEVANKIYAVPLFSPTVYVFDGATQAYLTSFDVGASEFGGTCGSVSSLAIDGAGGRLYAACNGISTQIGVVAIDTATGTTVGATLVNDFIGTGMLALDSLNHLLFFSTFPQYMGSGAPVVVDTISTTQPGADAGAEQVLGTGTFSSVGSSGVPGAAAVVTVDRSVTDGGVAGYVWSLEPSSAPLPAGFVPDTEAFVSPDSKSAFNVFGHDAKTSLPQIVRVDIGAEGTAPTVSHALTLDGTGFWGNLPATSLQVKYAAGTYVVLNQALMGGYTSVVRYCFHYQEP